jgi:hypothetical protein
MRPHKKAHVAAPLLYHTPKSAIMKTKRKPLVKMPALFLRERLDFSLRAYLIASFSIIYRLVVIEDLEKKQENLVPLQIKSIVIEYSTQTPPKRRLF